MSRRLYYDEEEKQFFPEDDVPEKHGKTNADRVRSKTDEELAYFLTSEDFCALFCGAPLVCDGNCAPKVFEWLKQEVIE